MSNDKTDRSSTTEAGPASPYQAPAPTAPVAGDVVVGDLVVAPIRASLIARLGAEALGTYFLVLVGVGISLYALLLSAGGLGVPLGFGLALIGAMVAFGPISGGHFNPAVTLGAAIAGRTAWVDVLPYWLAQLVGGALAAGTLFLTIPTALPDLITQAAGTTKRVFFTTTANGFGSHGPLAILTKTQKPPVSFDVLPALLIEIIATALLVAVVLNATSRRTRGGAPFAIGLTYAALIMVASPITNAGLNPARSTAAALFSDSSAFSQLWLFWVAPLIGAAIAGLAYRAFAADRGQYNLLEDDDLLVEEEELIVDGPQS